MYIAAGVFIHKGMIVMKKHFVETKEEGMTRTHCRCSGCGEPITDIEKANVIWKDGELLGFFHQGHDDKNLPDNENLRDWLYRLIWAGGQSDEEFATWYEQIKEFGA
jgi:hypothetical protein